MIKLIAGGAGVGTKGMQQRDGPEEEKKELSNGNSSTPNVNSPFKNMPFPAPTSTEVMIERY